MVIKMSKQKKLGAALGVALFLVLAVVLGVIWSTSRPEPVSGGKHITVEVIHSDGSKAQFTYDTGEEYLGTVLVNEGLISGSESDYGLFVETVDGETADFDADGSWWKLSCNGEDSQVGVDSVVIHDADLYTWTYTVG